MRFSENDDVVQAIPTYGADEPFTVRILPRAPRCGDDFLDADRSNPFLKLFSINPVTIPQEIPRFAPVGKRLDDLLTGPACGRMFRYVEMHDTPAIMGKNNQDKQNSKGSSGHHEKVDGDHVLDMIIQEGAPCLGRRLSFFGISRVTVRSEILIPSLSSSPWILGLPQVGLAWAILRTNSRISLPVPGRPAPPCFERCVQYNANPFRCHQMTVSGLTTMRDSRHLCHTEERHAQKSRSLRRKRAWGRLRFKIASCCRSARFSRASSVRFLSPDFTNKNNKNSASIMMQKPACW